MLKAITVLAVATLAGSAFAQPMVIDGTRDGGPTGYATTLGTVPNYPWAQNIQTQFGDNQNELNNLTAASTPTNVQVFVGGNLVPGNRFELFFDNRSGGGVANLNGTGNNITLDTGMLATHYLSINISGGTTFVDAAVWTGSAWAFQYLGSFNGTWSPSGSPLAGFSFAYNGSNTAGVTAGTGSFPTATSNLVGTGFEYSIPQSWLGVGVATPVRVAGFVTNGNRDFVSNQFIGGFSSGSQGNLGGDASVINLNSFAGTQWVEIPTPGAAALLGLGGLLAAKRRRK